MGNIGSVYLEDGGQILNVGLREHAECDVNHLQICDRQTYSLSITNTPMSYEQNAFLQLNQKGHHAAPVASRYAFASRL